MSGASCPTGKVGHQTDTTRCNGADAHRHHRAHDGDPMPDLLDHLDAPPIARRLADVIARWAFDGHDGPLAAAVRILADPDIASCLHRLAQLDAAHQPREWAGSSTGAVCQCGRGAHPCDVRRVLDGLSQ